MQKKTDYKTFLEITNKQKNNGSNILNADNVELSNDEACKIACETWREVMNNNYQDKEDTLFSFTDYMENLRKLDPEFAFEILNDSEGEVTGCFWMTSTMRKNFELFGSFICVDAMKRDINTLIWPYMATTMYNEMNSVCVGCEGIVIGEREEAYNSMLDFQVRYSRRSKSEVKAISSDGFLSQPIIEGMGFTTTKFIIDFWHLFHSILPKQFGLHDFNIIQHELIAMTNSCSEEKCAEHFEAARQILIGLHSRTEEKLNHLYKFFENRETYALYAIRQIPGTRGYRGSTCAESNHSSLIIHLNNGVRGVTRYSEEPTTLFKDMLERQRSHILKWNKKLYDDESKLKVELDFLSKDTMNNSELEAGGKVLCLNSYVRYKKNWKRAIREYSLHRGNEVRHNVHTTSTPRVFLVEVDGTIPRCNCDDRVSYEEQCVHEIVMHRMKFKRELFASWHMRRRCITCSSNPNPVQTIQENESGPFSGTAILDDESNSTTLIPFLGQQDESMVNCYDATNRFESIHYKERNMLSQTKSVTDNELHKLNGEISGSFRNCSQDTKKKVYAILLDLRHIVQHDSKIATTLSLSQNSTCDNDILFDNIITNYRKSFTVAKGSFRPSSLHINPVSPEVRKKQPKKRLMSNQEKFSRNSKTHKKSKAMTCSFCKGSSHKVSCCPIRQDHKFSGRELILCKGDLEIMNDLIDGIERRAIIYPMLNEYQPLIDLDTKSTRNIIIQKAYSFSSRNRDITSGYMRFNSLNFLIKFLNGNGQPMGELMVTGRCLSSWLDTANRRQAKTYVYDQTRVYDSTHTSLANEEESLVEIDPSISNLQNQGHEHRLYDNTYPPSQHNYINQFANYNRNEYLQRPQSSNLQQMLLRDEAFVQNDYHYDSDTLG